MSSKLIITDETYRSWIREISSRFRKSQIKAAVKVNDEMLRFYWSLGRDLAEKKTGAGIGNGFYNQLSKDLQNLLPDVKSFSPTNLKYMQYFYELYSSPQVVDSAGDQLSPQAADSMDMLFSIPWGPLGLQIVTGYDDKPGAVLIRQRADEFCFCGRNAIVESIFANLVSVVADEVDDRR